MKKYHKWINWNKYKLIPKKDKYIKSIPYDVCCHPSDYIKPLISINRRLQCHEMKLFNAIPLRTNIIPKYITLDTCSIITLFGFSYSNLSSVKENQHYVWNKLFRLNRRVFKKKEYKFNHMIKTNGVCCSVLLIKTDRNGNPIKMNKGIMKKLSKMNESNDKRYIEEQDNIKRLLEDKNYVVIDPNLSDLMYCMDKDGKIFIYIQNQRRMETKHKKYNLITNYINKKTIIGNTSVTQIQTKLSDYNSKTCYSDDFTEYLTMKNKINHHLFEHYAENIHRKLKWKDILIHKK